MYLPLAHSTIVAPSGLLPSVYISLVLRTQTIVTTSKTVNTAYVKQAEVVSIDICLVPSPPSVIGRSVACS